MSNMDPYSKDVVRQTAAGAVEGFMNTVGAPLVELGQWGADYIRLQRWKTQYRIIELAKAFCERRGIDPEAIPLKTLGPLIQYMSLENDPETSKDPEGAADMQERWAALLANAAMGEAGVEVMPGFPHILSELTAPEAEILDFLRSRQDESYGRPTALDTLMDEAEIEPWSLGVPDDPRYGRFMVQLGNLERQGLCIVRRPNKELAEVVRLIGNDLRRVRIETNTVVELTELGQAFISACTPPAELEADRLGEWRT